jgi:hypothetical protein
MALTQKQINDLQTILESLGLTIAAEEIYEVGFLVARFVLASEASKSFSLNDNKKVE